MKYAVITRARSALCLIIVGLCVTAFLGVKRWSQNRIPKIDFTGRSLTIDKWRVVGPFTAANSRDPIAEENWLSAERVPTSSSSSNSPGRGFWLNTMPSKGTSHSLQSVANVNAEFIDFHNLYDIQHTHDPSPNSAYAGCIVTATKPEQVWILLGYSEYVKAWINGQLFYTKHQARALNTYDVCMPIQLRRGENFLAIQVARSNNLTWGLTVRIEPTKEIAAQTALRMQNLTENLLLDRVIVEDSSQLRLAPRGVPKGVIFPVSIENEKAGVIKRIVMESSDDSPTLSFDLPAGIYKMILVVDGQTYVQHFAVGSANSVAHLLIDRVNQLTQLSEDHRLNLDTLIRRLGLILRSQSQQASSPWAIKFVAAAVDLQAAIDRIDHRIEPFTGSIGLHIRAFRSTIDDSIQTYRIYIPSSYRPTTRPLSLAILMPTIVSANRPFVESAFLSDQGEANKFVGIAEHLGIGILWCGYRTQPKGQPIEFTHFEEVLAAVGKDYDIDKHHMSLVGSCSGSALSLMTAMRWPNRFSAIAMLNPTFNLLDRPEIGDEYSRKVSLEEWLDQQKILNRFLSARNLPIYIISDGDEPGHGTIEEALRFVKGAREGGASVILERGIQTIDGHFGAWSKLFDWVKRQRRIDELQVTDSPQISTMRNLADVENAFANRFLLVAGTGETAADRIAIGGLVRQFQNTWEKMYFGQALSCNDQAVDLRLQMSNLVLIGNEKTNRLWNELARMGKIRMNDDSIAIHGHSWRGQHLAVIATIENPFHTDRQIVFIGSEDLRDARFESLNLSADGWFHFAIWNTEKNPAELQEVGRW